MALRPLPLLLGSLLLASCLPPGTPPVCKCEAGFACVDGACQPLACSALDETDCLGRQDCQAVYVATDRCAVPADEAGAAEVEYRCGGQAFAACENKVCEPVACLLYCEHGMAKDANGCEVCACAPAYCRADSDCLPSEVCSLPAYDCAEGMRCAAPQGVCTPKVDPGCSSDAECQAGETCVFPEVDCPPNAFCAPARGTCKPVGGCVSDADCGVGRRCEFLDACMAIGCEAPVAGGICVDRKTCTDGSECGWGETCAMDPNDPCSRELCYMLLPAQMYCVPGCAMLGETECLSRRDCEAMYEGPRCGNDPTPATFTGCKPVGCPPVLCDLWCEKGYKVDPNGCNTCACDDSCASDADCLAGQRCEVPVYDYCPEGETCPVLKGTCVDVGCQSDADCASGETCVFTSTYCLGAEDGSNEHGGSGGCVGPAYGTCIRLETSCASDADCKAGQTCSIPEIVCPPGTKCPQPMGVCVDVVPPSSCFADADCGPGMRCEIDPMTNCGPATNCAGQCVTASCRSDADCRAGESCIFLMDACPPGDPACPNTGICNKVEEPRFCAADADCAANELCQLVDCGPNMDCMQQGVCTKRPECKTSAECAYGEPCQPDPTDVCNGDESYCFAPGRTICLPIPTCKSDADCAAGQKCAPDMTDPCNQPNVDCFAPGRNVCQ